MSEVEASVHESATEVIARLKAEIESLRAAIAPKRFRSPANTMQQDSEDIRDYLHHNPQRTVAQIAKHLELPESRVARLLSSMRKDKEVIWVGTWSAAHPRAHESEAGDGSGD